MASAAQKHNSINGQAHCEIPAWLNIEIFKNFLHDCIKDFVQIKQFTVKKYEMNTSLAKLRQSVAEQNIHIIMQVQLKDGKTKDLKYFIKIPMTPSASVGFQKQTLMYGELLPAFEELYKDAQNECKFSTNSYKFEKVINDNYILLDDVLMKGYKNASSTSGFDTAHTKAVLGKLAAFHAASVVYCEKYRLSKLFEAAVLPKDLNAKFEIYNRKFHEGLRFYGIREYQDKIKSYQAYFMDSLTKLDKFDVQDFNVLLHGSCIANNVFFQYDAFGNVKSTLLMNFQHSQYGSPAKDLLQFLLATPCLTNKWKDFDFYIKYYHDQLIDNLKLLNYKQTLLTLTDLHLAILKYSSWGFLAVSKIMPVVLIDALIEADIDVSSESADESEVLQVLYSNSSYAKEIVEIVPWLENRGFLEV